MSASRTSVAALCLLTAVVLQLSVVNRLALPYGRPDLALVVVVSLALCQGPLIGALAGFATGLAGDLLSLHTLGLLALTWCLVGYLAGLFHRDADRSIAVPMVAQALAAGFAGILEVELASVLPASGIHPVGTLSVVASAVVYDSLLTPFVFPVVRGLVRRLDQTTRP